MSSKDMQQFLKTFATAALAAYALAYYSAHVGPLPGIAKGGKA